MMHSSLIITTALLAVLSSALLLAYLYSIKRFTESRVILMDVLNNNETQYAHVSEQKHLDCMNINDAIDKYRLLLTKSIPGYECIVSVEVIKLKKNDYLLRGMCIVTKSHLAKRLLRKHKLVHKLGSLYLNEPTRTISSFTQYGADL